MHLNDNIAHCTGVARRRGQQFGVELEYEGWNGKGKDGAERWQVIPDNSLRNKGIEFVSQPFTKREMPGILNEARTLISTGKVQSNARCGVHVHINMLDSTWAELWNLSVLYTLLEPTIFQQFAPGRCSNHFCVPSHSNNMLAEVMQTDILRLRQGKKYVPPAGAEPVPAGMVRQRFLRDVGGGNVQFVYENVPADPVALPPDELMQMLDAGIPDTRRGTGLGIYGTSKYSAMNFKRIQDLGTVEMRQFPATKDMGKVRNWIEFLAGLQQFSTEFDDPLRVIEHYEEVGLRYLTQELGLDRQFIDTMDQDEAENVATFMAGYIPPNHEDLDWTMKGA